ncbi:MAG: ATP-dependent metallopeptidase FtsH/Yme1/Tma family protein [Pseudobdellovibrionaceae bacterium]|nr:ATP-dependent zinc metalloprotease FtsH [Bdellovibrionales bacterium]USN48365.1 MAG: ATP-dependent metallopeptidase FtsH/Yme1/Tma family protein [Pseudobdellovibrionaceae bacterium]
MRTSQKTLAMWAIFAVVIVLLYQMYEVQNREIIRDFNYSKFEQAVKNKEIKEGSIVFRDGEILGEIDAPFLEGYRGKRFQIVGNTETDGGYKLLKDNGYIPNYERADNSLLTSVFLNWLPLILIFGLFIFLFRQLQAGGGKAMSFGKSRARLLTENKNKVTFKDVAGVEEAKEELAEIVQFLKEPKKFTRLGGRIPKGVLLVGPPGTGKTLLARAVAGEANVPFFTISGSDFVEMFVGVGASRVRDLFEQGKKNAPCLIFIDEIDAVGRHRGAGMGGGHDEREQTLNQLLVEMDGFESNEGVILIAATNRPDVLDPALLRPGRFDRRVVVNKPDLVGREKILGVHVRKTPLASDVDLEKVARGTPGFSGADLENLVNEAALIAAREDKHKVTMHDFEKAKDKVLMGSERRSMVISEEDKRITAYHEAGHTLVGKKLPGMDPIHKVSIIPRGMALGVTQTLPKEDTLNLTKSKATNTIAFLFGGRAAEEIIFEDYTTGAGNDIERATDLARSMVCEWGMSEKIGPLALERREGPVFLGMQSSQSKEYSDSKAEEIDKEVYRLVTEGHEKAKQILRENVDVLHNLAKALLEHETIDGEEVNSLIEGMSLEEMSKRRGHLKEKMAAEQKEAAEKAEQQERLEKSKKEDPQGGRDPMGNPGPITA